MEELELLKRRAFLKEQAALMKAEQGDLSPVDAQDLQDAVLWLEDNEKKRLQAKRPAQRSR